jgi:flavin-dependent dehydrogenase
MVSDTANQAQQAAHRLATSADVVVVGGGLGGLCASILLAKAGHSVILIERKTYPFHRVCGEYISLESWAFLERLGIPLSDLKLPILKRLRVSSPAGRAVSSKLPLGGFGISRYLLDYALAQLAQDAGVTLLTYTTVEAVTPDPDNADRYWIDLNKGPRIQTRFVIGAFGKRSNLDMAWKRPFVMAAEKAEDQSEKRLNKFGQTDHRAGKGNPYHNYIGVKWHLRADLPKDIIELHNFSNGYAGISAIEGEKYCFCYLTTAANLRLADNSIDQMEHDILSRNPILKRYLNDFPKVWERPQVISQISFADKNSLENGVWMLGDAAGMITPLCGNGMSMAMHSAAIAAPLISAALKGNMPRTEAESTYQQLWKAQFGRRVWVGRQIQASFGHPILTEAVVAAFKLMPWAIKPLIGLTHGKPF